MSKGNNSSIENLLPSYEIIYERSKKWSSMFDNYVSKHDDISKSVGLVGPLQFPDENESESNTAESVDISEFEDNLEEDDREFNYEEILEQTMAVVEARKKLWEESGIDLDICDVTEVRDKVGQWLANSPINEVKGSDNNLENEHIKVQKGDPGRSRIKVTKTMSIQTIKITETKDGQNISVANKKHRFKRLPSGDYDHTSKSRKEYDKRNKTKLRNYSSSPTNQDTGNKKYRKFKYSRYTSNRGRKHYPVIDSSSDFVSSSSSSSSDTSPQKYQRKSFRKQRQRAKQCSTNVNRVSFHPESVINSTEVMSCQSSPRGLNTQLKSFTLATIKVNNTKNPLLEPPEICKTIVNDFENKENHTSTNIESMKPISHCSSQLVESNINVRPNTTLKNDLSLHKKPTDLEPLNWTNSLHQNRYNSHSSSPEKTYKGIFVYSAKDSNKFVDSIIDNKVHLKKEHLINALGEKLSEHYLKNNNVFLYQCDVSSDLVYELPQLSDSSGDDIMDLPQKRGKLTEIKRPTN